MQPPAPPRYRRLLTGRWGLPFPLSQLTTMTFRHMLRRPLRALFTSLGISLAVGLLVTALLMYDTIDMMLDIGFFRADRQHATLMFSDDKHPRALQAVERLPGVLRAEPFRVVSARLRNGHLARKVAITGKPAHTDLSRTLGTDLKPVSLPKKGLVVDEYLAKVLQLRRGDLVEVDLLQGRRGTLSVPVADIITSYLGLVVLMELDALQTLAGNGPRLSGVYIAYDTLAQRDLFAAIKATPAIATIGLQRQTLALFRDTIEKNMTYSLTIFVVLAVIIAFGIVYNSARIQLSEHARDLASLRVLGFTRAEVSYVLLAELALLTLFALPIGGVIGYGFGQLTMLAFESDIVRIPFAVERATYAWASLVVVAATAVSALLVRRRVDRLDLIAVLKTRD
jgi:putative ABC transport system permease protein